MKVVVELFFLPLNESEGHEEPEYEEVGRDEHAEADEHMYKCSEPAELEKGEDNGNVDKEGPGGSISILMDEDVEVGWIFV